MKKIFIILSLGLIHFVFGQIKQDSIISKNLNEKVKLQIYLPKEYKKNNKAFPVIYLLDSDINLGYFVPMMEFQKRAYKEKGKSYIVVGIETSNRSKNFTPTQSSIPDPKHKGQTLFSDSGGAENFIRFLNEELKPFINQNYRAENYSVLVGHSFGGLLALDILLTHPDYFQAYVANDPSLWWDNAYLLKLSEKIKNRPEKLPLVFISKAEQRKEGHTFDASQPNTFPIFKAFLEKYQYPYKAISYPDENHGTLSYKANFDAVRWINENKK